MRGRMNDVKSYIPPFQIGEVLQAGVVGEVVTSNFDGIAEGDHVTGMLGWENYSSQRWTLAAQTAKERRAAVVASGHSRHAGYDGLCRDS